MSIDRPNLADAFTATRRPTPDRAASLAGLLPASRPRPVPAEPATAPTAVVDAPPSVATADPASPDAAAPAGRRAPRPSRTSTPTRAQPMSETAYTVTNVAVYLEPDLLEQTKIARRTTDRTYDDLVVQAFADVTDDELQTHFRASAPVTELTGMPTRQRRPRGTAGIQIQLRLSGVQTAWLSEKQQRLGAPSRSALVAAALRLHLLR